MNSHYQNSVNLSFGVADEEQSVNNKIAQEIPSAVQSQVPSAIGKKKLSSTENSLSNSDIEVYGLAALKLLQQSQFFECFKLLDTGFNRLSIGAPERLEKDVADFEALRRKVLISVTERKEYLIEELDFVKTFLLNPIESSDCFAAFILLAEHYSQADRDLSTRFANAYFEALTNVEYKPG